MPRIVKSCEERFCKNCGVLLERKRFNGRLEDYTAFLKRNSCSRSCGNSREEPQDRTTFLVRARHFRGKLCEICGSLENLDSHHLDGDIRNNSKENIQTLCHRCHMKLHWKLRRHGIVYGSHNERNEQIVIK